MKKRFDGLIWIGLGISLLMALFLSPYASSSPDGLEKVAEMKGFKDNGEGWTFWRHAPLRDYTIPWIRNEKVSKAVSGLIGTLALFLIVFGVGKWMSKPRTKRAQPDLMNPPDPDRRLK